MLTKIKSKLAQTFTGKKLIIGTVTILLSLSLVGQIIIYVKKSGLPTVSFNNTQLNTTSKPQLYSAILDKTQHIEIKTEHSSREISLKDIGVTIDEDQLNKDINNIKTWHNLIPFWGLYNIHKEKDIKLSYNLDRQTLKLQSESLSAQLSTEPVSARITQKDSKIVIQPETPGIKTNAKNIQDAIIDFITKTDSEFTIYIPSDKIQPEITSSDIQAVVDKYQSIALQPLEIIVDGKKNILNSSDILSMIEFGTDNITLNKPVVDELIAKWSKDVSVVPGVTQVEYLDDVEIARTTGAPGRALDKEKAYDLLESWFADPSSSRSITLNSYEVPPTVIETRNYSTSSAGLQKVIENWDSANAGSYYIAIQEIGGIGREAYLNSNTPVVMASTYKVFLSVAAYRMAENNELSLSTVIYQGNSIEDCISKGIIYSDNSCMVALGNYIGWSYADSIIHNLGYTGVRLNNYNADGSFNGDKTANAKDLTKILAQLEKGLLLSSTNRGKLLSYMKQSIYRDGIPSGSPGATVANKVGFLYGYKHDMAIVYGKNSTYSLTVLSNNSSWDKIESISKVIFDYME